MAIRTIGRALVRPRRTHWGWYAAGYLVLAVLTLWSLFPLYWLLVTAVKSQAEMYSRAAILWPQQMTWVNFDQVLFRSSFPRALLNSLIVAAVVTPVSIALSALCAYSLTRLRYRGRRLVARLLVGSYLVPGAITFIATYALMVRLGLLSTLQGLMLAQVGGFVAFGTWMLVGYFRSLPVELEEAALVDGATRWVVLWQIVLPLALPAIVVVAIYSFTASWNDFLLPVVLLQRQDVVTAPAALTFFAVSDVTYWGPIMASATLMAIPPVLLYLLLQRWVVEGWTVGAVKG
jgi:multiple sugar transport system permease protein